MNDRVNEYIHSWIEKTDNDLKNAELVHAARDENRPYDAVCFHCQHLWFPADEALRGSSYDKLLPPLVDVRTVQGVCCRTDG
jgi:hypothetical protein